MIFDSVQAGAACIGAIASCVMQILTGEFTGKAIVAPEVLHIDVIENRQTTERLDMIAFRTDATLICNNGWCIKPTYTYGSKNCKYSRGGVGAGYYVPLCGRIIAIPTAGYYYTRLNTKIDNPLEEIEIEETEADEHVKERFRASTIYLGGDVTFVITECLRITATYQYAWSRSHTKLKDLLKAKDHTTGQLYNLEVDYIFSRKIGLSGGIEYDQTLSREKYGLRTFSAKAGLSYWF